MKRLIVAAAFLTLALSATVDAQRWGNQAQAGFAPYGFGVFTNVQRANVRLDVSPADAQVFVDASYVGRIDAFNNSFQRLALAGGPHHIEIRKAGFTSVVMEIAVFPGQDVTFSRKLQPARGADDVEVIPPASNEDPVPPCNGPSGALRLDVTPKDADVYADGYYVGRVSDFNSSQHLLLTQDQHHIVLKRDGFDSLAFKVTIDSDHPAVYRAALKKQS